MSQEIHQNSVLISPSVTITKSEMSRKGEVKRCRPPHWWVLAGGVVFLCCRFLPMSVAVSWMWYLKNSLREFQICHISLETRTMTSQHTFWPFHTIIMTELMTFHIPKGKRQLHCDVMIFCWTCSGHYCYSSGTVTWLVCGGKVAILVVRRPLSQFVWVGSLIWEHLFWIPALKLLLALSSF